MIYLDYTANTPADPAVLDAFVAAERRYIANPNSTHIAGRNHLHLRRKRGQQPCCQGHCTGRTAYR